MQPSMEEIIARGQDEIEREGRRADVKCLVAVGLVILGALLVTWIW